MDEILNMFKIDDENLEIPEEIKDEMEEIRDSIFRPIKDSEKALIYANLEIERNTLDYIKTDKLIVEKVIQTIKREIELEKSTKESFSHMLNSMNIDETTRMGLMFCMNETASNIELQELELDETEEDYEIAKKNIKKIEKSIKKLEAKLEKLS